MRSLEWIERYDISSTRETHEGWAILHIDSAGFLGVVSDYGNYAYHWSSFGDDFKKFLSEIDADYLYGKLTNRLRVYDGEATLKRIREELAQARQSNSLSDEELADELSLLEYSDLDEDPCSFQRWLEDTKLCDAHELAQFRYDLHAQIFCEKIWPKFVAALAEGRCRPVQTTGSP